MSTGKKKRVRATVVAQQDGKVLLVRERDTGHFGLPGGGIESGEYVMEAALRELREETRLRPYWAKRLFNYEGTTQLHRVVLVQAAGKVKLQRKELDKHLWWDGDESVPMFPYAEAILRKCRIAV